MRISTIIVNYNGKHLLYDCLRSLEAQTRVSDEIIVVDNGSADDSVPMMRRRFPYVTIIEAGENLGFAAGNNLGIRRASGDVVILLNNDTVAGPGFIEEAVEPLEEDESLSAVAAVLLFASAPDYVASAGIDVYQNGLALDHGIGQRWRDLERHVAVFGPSAGAAAYRRSSLDDAGCFAEHFFLYLEDADLAWKLRLRGLDTVASARAWVLHVYSASSTNGSKLKDFYLARNRAWTLIRCWPRGVWRRCWHSVLWYEIGAIGYAVLKRRWGSIVGRLRGWASVGALWRQRRAIQSNTSASDEQLLYWLVNAPRLTTYRAMRARISELAGRAPAPGNERAIDQHCRQ